MANPGKDMNLANQIFTDMVMDEAIKDKEIQIKEQYKDEDGNVMGDTLEEAEQRAF